METTNPTYDCAIIGGGLSGLCLSIQLAQQGIKTILFEKNEYPFHKVCGEYISMESWSFLQSLGLNLQELNLPIITELGVSSEQGFMLNAKLPLGGFGISRYTLDNLLYQLAVSKSVTVIQNCKVNNVDLVEGKQAINTTKGIYYARIVCGSYGKYTPVFIQNNSHYVATQPQANYIGVKYHVNTNLPANRIELHNFKDGYCGISKVDDDKYCFCYLSNVSNLKANNNDIKTMEKKVLYQNPFLKNYFTQTKFIKEQPLVISNITFHKKQTSVDNLFLLGDAAGTITPLCGNGMSMGMRASKLLAEELYRYFDKKCTTDDLAKNYHHAWNKAFNTRIKTGYYLQGLFGKKQMTHFTLKFLSNTPRLTQKIISLTHGEKF